MGERRRAGRLSGAERVRWIVARALTSMRGAVIGAGVALAVVAAPVGDAAAVGIQGDDDRRPILGEAWIEGQEYPWPWQAIGHVNRGGGSLCTGALVAPDLVLTARHCLINPKTGHVSADGVTFAAGFRSGVFDAKARAASVISRDALGSAGTLGVAAGAGGATDFEIGGDFALIRLESSMTIRPLPVASDDRLRSVMAAPSYVVLPSYSHDHRDVLTLHERCIVEGRFEDPLWRHSCDGTSGASGSPILVDALGDRQNAAIAGVLVGYRRDGAPPRGLMVPAPVIRAFLKRIGIALD